MSSLRKLKHDILARSPMLMDLATRFKDRMAAKHNPFSAPVVDIGLAEGDAPTITAPPAPKVYPSARAQRPIGIFYDELSRGVNPFSLVKTLGVCDASEGPERVRELFDQYGIVKVRGVYSPDRSTLLNDHCIDFSGLKPLDFRDVFTGKKKWATGGSPVLHDERFWPFAMDGTVKQIIHQLLGEYSFEFGTAVTAHYSARGLHRDYRMLVENDKSEYSVDNPKRRIIRVLHYCGIAGGALGYIPFSHNEQKFAEISRRIGLKHDTAWFDRHREVLTEARLKKTFVNADEIERHVCWAYADPGDILVTNSAMLHCGEYLTGPRYFFVSTYAQNVPGPVKLAAAGVQSGKAKAYYRHQVEQGFKGAKAVLDFKEAA
jgi:hypothetical protein